MSLDPQVQELLARLVEMQPSVRPFCSNRTKNNIKALAPFSLWFLKCKIQPKLIPVGAPFLFPSSKILINLKHASK